MRIEVGSLWLCLRDVVMKPGNYVAYKEGKRYKSEVNSCITDEKGNMFHYWLNLGDGDKIFNTYFRLLVRGKKKKRKRV